jgi:hypothetical protein
MESHDGTASPVERCSRYSLQVRPMTQTLCKLEQRLLALTQHQEVEGWSEIEQSLRLEGRLHATRDDQRLRRERLGSMRQRKVITQRHCGGGEADEIPPPGSH